MKLAPLKNYRGPDYPTREILDQHPELLRVLPRRWRNSPVVLGTLAGLLALMEQSEVRAADKSALHVAPIFEHGSGQGAFGCVAESVRSLFERGFRHLIFSLNYAAGWTPRDLARLERQYEKIAAWYEAETLKESKFQPVRGQDRLSRPPRKLRAGTLRARAKALQRLLSSRLPRGRFSPTRLIRSRFALPKPLFCLVTRVRICRANSDNSEEGVFEIFRGSALSRC